MPAGSWFGFRRHSADDHFGGYAEQHCCGVYLFHVLTTGNGEQVAPLAKQHKPALILLDLMLPGKDGVSVLGELKGNEETRMIPVIVVSGKESHEQVQQAMMAGAIDYVIKPFEPMELGTRIKNFLDTLNDITPDSSAEAPPPSPGFGGLR